MKIAVVAAVASLVLLSACSGEDQHAPGTSPSVTSGTAAAAPAGSVAPAGRLAAAATRTGGGTYTFKTTSAALTVDGAADPAGPTSTGKAVITVDKATIAFESLFAAGTYLVRITGLPGIDGQKWLRIDRAKLKGADPLGVAEVKDPTGLSGLPGVVSTATTTDGREFKGTLDLTMGGYSVVGPAAAKGLGDLARAVPFTATVDEQGYLTSVKVSVPAYAQTKADEVTVAYGGFGAPLRAPSPPASEVIDAPTAAYSLLNGK
ncbi:hypothetical protein AB0M46_49060 [Dactylosporangium sp. NPDC051485]|uniref:hypothetical protein n=1 Tax=Dactylosporangium sp. NPDC051485 TaxID=3154846 RepID=UPI00341CC9EE